MEVEEHMEKAGCESMMVGLRRKYVLFHLKSSAGVNQIATGLG